jgi:hypothetical protein
VDQAAPVRRVERAGRLLEEEDRRFRRQPAALLEHLPQVGSGHAAHRDVKQPVARPHVVNGDNVRVVHRRGDPRFLKEPRAEDIVARQCGIEHFQRDHIAEARVLGPEHNAHAAPTEHRDQSISSKLLADQRQLGHAILPVRDYRQPWEQSPAACPGGHTVLFTDDPRISQPAERQRVNAG